MKELVLAAILISKTITITAYRSVPDQTDDSPFVTSIGDSVRKGGAAVSRDLLCGACRKLHKRCLHPDYPKKLHYGDWLYVKDVGFLKINDAMGAVSKQRINNRVLRIPIKQHIDVWVANFAEEKAFHKKWGGKPVEVWKVKVSEN